MALNFRWSGIHDWSICIYLSISVIHLSVSILSLKIGQLVSEEVWLWQKVTLKQLLFLSLFKIWVYFNCLLRIIFCCSCSHISNRFFFNILRLFFSFLLLFLRLLPFLPLPFQSNKPGPSEWQIHGQLHQEKQFLKLKSLEITSDLIWCSLFLKYDYNKLSAPLSWK